MLKEAGVFFEFLKITFGDAPLSSCSQQRPEQLPKSLLSKKVIPARGLDSYLTDALRGDEDITHRPCLAPAHSFLQVLFPSIYLTPSL